MKRLFPSIAITAENKQVIAHINHMLDAKGIKRVMKEINGHRGDTKDRCYKLAFDERTPQTFYAIISGLDGVFTDGEYIMKIKIPDNYPFGAPVICLETPNGKFIPGSKICLNITHFHSETWSPLVTLEKLIISIISLLGDTAMTTGVGFMNTSDGDKKELAMYSKEYNKKHFSTILSMNMV